MLLVPEQFPTDENPTAGIFMREQIKALGSFSQGVVFNASPWARGRYTSDSAAQYYDFHAFDRKPPLPLRLPAYAWWERRSFEVGQKIPPCDLIHLHGAALRGGWAMRLAESWGVPLVVTEHTGPWSVIADRPRIWKRAKKVLESASAVLPVSRHLAGEIRNSGIHPQYLEVLGNPVDTDLFSLRPHPPKNPKTILFLGRLDPFKGGLRTLQAYREARNTLGDYRLEIIGQGPESEAIRAFISAHGLEGKVDFREAVLGRAEMRDVFHRASFLVFPSLFESFGLVAAEALSTGLPVVVTNRTGPRDFSTPESTVAVDPESVSDIARCMCEMAGRWEQMQPDRIRKSVEEKFGWRQYALRLKALYRQLV